MSSHFVDRLNKLDMLLEQRYNLTQYQYENCSKSNPG